MEYIYCLDLGTDSIKMLDLLKKKILVQKDSVAIKNQNELFAVGSKAYAMYAKSPYNIKITFPMKHGVIADYNNMAYMLERVLDIQKPGFFDKQIFIVAVPRDITEVEKRSFYKLIENISRKTNGIGLVDKSIATCIGIGKDVKRTRGLFVVDLGADTTEISVLAKGGIVYNKLIKRGGKFIDNVTRETIRKKYKTNISMFDAANLKIEFGDAIFRQNSKVTLYGTHTIQGHPISVEVDSKDICAGVEEYLELLVQDIMKVYDLLSPEIRSYILNKGIYITGGVSKIRHLKSYLYDHTGLQIHLYKEPETLVVRGLKRIYELPEFREYIISYKSKKGF